MCCFVILLLSNEMQMSVRRFSAIPHLRAKSGQMTPSLSMYYTRTKTVKEMDLTLLKIRCKDSKQHHV